MLDLRPQVRVWYTVAEAVRGLREHAALLQDGDEMEERPVVWHDEAPDSWRCCPLQERQQHHVKWSLCTVPSLRGLQCLGPAVDAASNRKQAREAALARAHECLANAPQTPMD